MSFGLYTSKANRRKGTTPISTHPGEKVVLLFSGGLDSTTLLYDLLAQGYAVHALSIHYGQRNACEMLAAERILEGLPAPIVEHRTLLLDLRVFGGSALTSQLPVPKYARGYANQETEPSTYVPARNTIFLSYALAYAQTIGASKLFLGVNAVDNPGYPDCRPEYIEAFEHMARLSMPASMREGFAIHAPFVQWSKAQIIALGLKHQVPYANTLTCYDPDERGRACGHCNACWLRKEGFEALGELDPTVYRPLVEASDAVATLDGAPRKKRRNVDRRFRRLARPPHEETQASEAAPSVMELETIA